jgi:hypothetical protein
MAATNRWKNNKSAQDTTSTSDEVRGQASVSITIPVTDARSGKSSTTPLVVDGTQAA